MATTSSMFMYSLTIVPSTGITQAVVGQFSGSKEQQVLTASGSRLILYRVDANQGKLFPILHHDVFGIIRCLAVFRITGGSKDFIIITSDSGRICVIEYVPQKNKFNRLHLETFGKSGIRRVVPGQYLAADPKGRACIVVSLEKNKLVYVLNRNSQAQLTISSPLEAHKAQSVVYGLVALDVGYENPIFATLEVDYGECDHDASGQAYEKVEKKLVYYELDLGLNHVVRKWSDKVDRTANLIFQVSGGADGPSGVLVCSEENITYRHMNQDAFRVAIPRRKGKTEDPNRKRYITCGVMHKMRGAFFFLLQTEDGDLFKVTLDLVTDEKGRNTGDVLRVKIKYFDTVSIARSLVILKSGFLLVTAENGNHELYQFEKLGDEDGEGEFTSDDFPSDPTEPYLPVYFKPRALENIILSDWMESLNPMIDCKVLNLANEDASQIYGVCGTASNSSFKVIRHGLEVSEIVESELPSQPIFVWTTKVKRSDQYDSYIILSFVNATLVLSIGETVEEVTDTGFLSTASTIAVQLLGEDSLIQVHPKGIRHVKNGVNGRVTEWPVPQHRSIVAATTNERQVVVALSSGELVYFELDDQDNLAEYDEKRQMSGTVTCLSLGKISRGKLRSSFLAVGCDDSTVRILSLDPETTLESKSVQALTSAPSSLEILAMRDSTMSAQSSGNVDFTLYLHIGLYSGVYLRTVLDELTGDLSDTRTRFLGPCPVRLFTIKVHDQDTILALSSRSWLGYTNKLSNAYTLTPINYPALEWAWNFSSEQCAEGMVGIQGKNLRIFTIHNLSSNIIIQSTPLLHTPRSFVKHPHENLFYIIESDFNVLPGWVKRKINDTDGEPGQSQEELDPRQFGYSRGANYWSSCIQIINPNIEEVDQRVINTIELEDNESTVSLTIATFSSQDDEAFLLVGTAKDMIPCPRAYSCGYIRVYRFENAGKALNFIHKTKLEKPPTAIKAFQGKLLVGVGTDIRLYDLGIRQMLRKAQATVVPNILVNIQTQGSRIVCADVQESVSFAVYKFAENRIIPFCCDIVARWVTCSTMVDYETIAGGDKFGNIWLVRCPKEASEEADEEGSAHLIHERPYLQGYAHRLNLMMHFHSQDIPMAIQKATFTPGGREVLFWAGFQGTLGIFVPFLTREDVDFFQSLEQHLRNEDSPLAGRDHLIYRSYYAPVKGVIDGDLCERFLTLEKSLKEKISAELDRTVRDVERKIGDMRLRVAF